MSDGGPNNTNTNEEQGATAGQQPNWSPPDNLDEMLETQLGQDTNKRWPLRRQEVDTNQLAEELAKRLDHASHVLLDRLFGYLSGIPADESRRKKVEGLTLPASVIGWLSTQIYPRGEEENDDPLSQMMQSESAWLMGASMRDRISLLKYLLPRATHLRITSDVWPPPVGKKDASSLNSSVSFEGRDLDLSHLSVHSGVTMETSFNNAAPTIQSFLLYYNNLQVHPRVDLRVFPNLSVLFLDGVPPEWVVNMSSLHDKLKLFRSERGCIFDLTTLLFGKEVLKDTGNPLAMHSMGELSKLTHLKLCCSSIGESSGLRGRQRRLTEQETNESDMHQQQQYVVKCPPPLSRLPQLVSLSLANNEIRTMKSALSGLAQLPNLSLLDLSHNRLRTMKGANRMLGNIKTLNLTGNLLQNVAGLEKLFSLEALLLGDNNLQDLADVAGLGNLPELSSLVLKGNPFIEGDPVRYRVKVLDLFKSKRFDSLIPGATYRHLLQILPLLDGSPATKRELLGLKSLTFHRAIPPLIVSVVTEPEVVEECRVAPPETPSSIGSPPGNAGEGKFSFSPVLRPKKVTRRIRKGKAVVLDEETDAVVKGDYDKPASGGPLGLPEIGFSMPEVISSLSKAKERRSYPKSKISCSPMNGTKSASCTLETYRGEPTLSFVAVPSVQNAEDQSLDKLLNETEMLLEQAQEAIDAAETSNLLDNYSAASLIPRGGTALISPECLSDSPDPKNSAACKSQPSPDLFTVNGRSSGHDDETPLRATAPKVLNTSFNPFEDGVGVEGPASPAKSANKSITSQGEDSGYYLARTKVDFPENVWHDGASVASSLGTGGIEFPSNDNYLEAEASSIYDGPDGYRKLSVAVNLELYFRLFVFPSKVADVDSSVDIDDDLLSKIALESSPRVQLRPVDRKVAEEGIKEAIISTKALGLRETFKKVWQEELVACGKSAARRVASHKKLRRGFHGEPLFLDGSIQFVSESRKIIMCTSDTAIYLIPDYDPVSIKRIQENSSRKFPAPVPQEALFQNGIWPHALARLPISSLKRITIGFSFQRLTLHFAPSSELERALLGNALAFILATSNKMNTVKLLQHLQDLTKETANVSKGGESNNVIIDNDDKQVLDALSVAVTPIEVDHVLHYQVLQQRWKHGDRGTVRRACVITDNHIFLLDEDYVGDGSESYDSGTRSLGEVRYSMVHSAELTQIVEVQAATSDPREITIVIKPQSRLQRTHNWRLLCRDSDGAERLVDDARKAVAMATEST